MSLPSQVGETGPAPGERALIARLRAPCCWQQTLDVHDGPVADSLRAEVRKRLWAGETAEGIEADLVARYGERVVAVPQSSPIIGISLGMMGASALLAALLFLRLRKWRRAGQAPSSPVPTPVEADGYDEKLDDELRAMSS